MVDINTPQFTILGMSGSGKTSYLLGVYKKMSAGIKGFSFSTDDDTDVVLRTRFERMSSNDLGIDRFPLGTDQVDIYKFTLEYTLDPIMDFNWIDYPGDALNEKKSGDIDTYNNLSSYILNSQVLFICVDGSLLGGTENNNDKIEILQDNCSSSMNLFFSRYLKENNYLPPIAIIITKADLCDNSCTNDNYEKIIREAFNPLFAKNSKSHRFVSIIPVSLGRDISINNYTGKISPKRVEIPIYMAIWFTLKLSLNNIKNEQINLSFNISEAEQKKSFEKNKFFFFRSESKIKSLESNIKFYAEELRKIRANIEKSKDDLKRLLEVLNKNNQLVYFNGNKYKLFQDAAENYIKYRISNDGKS